MVLRTQKTAPSGGTGSRCSGNRAEAWRRDLTSHTESIKLSVADSSRVDRLYVCLRGCCHRRYSGRTPYSCHQGRRWGRPKWSLSPPVVRSLSLLIAAAFRRPAKFFSTRTLNDGQVLFVSAIDSLVVRFWHLTYQYSSFQKVRAFECFRARYIRLVKCDLGPR